MPSVNLRVHDSGEVTHGEGYVDSDDGRHRYRQWNIWDADLAPAMFVLLHAQHPDGRVERGVVIDRCADLARSWGSGGVVVVSLYSIVTDNPGRIASGAEKNPVGPDADSNIGLAACVVDVVVAAWGSAPFANERARHVPRIVGQGPELSCLGRTAIGGYPTDPMHQRVKVTGGRRFPFVTV